MQIVDLKKIAKKIYFLCYFSFFNRDYIQLSDDSEPHHQSREQLDSRVNKLIHNLKNKSFNTVRIVCNEDTYLLHVTILSWAIISDLIIIDISKISYNKYLLRDTKNIISSLIIPNTTIIISSELSNKDKLIIPNGVVLIPKTSSTNIASKKQLFGSDLYGQRFTVSIDTGEITLSNKKSPEVNVLDFRVSSANNFLKNME